MGSTAAHRKIDIVERLHRFAGTVSLHECPSVDVVVAGGVTPEILGRCSVFVREVELNDVCFGQAVIFGIRHQAIVIPIDP